MPKSISLAVLLTAVILAGCSSGQQPPVSELEPSPSATSTEASITTPPATSTGTSIATPAVPAKPRSKFSWLDLTLTDAATGKRFRLADYKGKPVLLHPFAVW